MSSHLTNDYVLFCQYRNTCLNSSILDLREVAFFQPTTLLPLFAFIVKNDVKKILLPKNGDVANYIRTMARTKFKDSKGKSYIPSSLSPTKKIELEEFSSESTNYIIMEETTAEKTLSSIS